MKRKQKRILRLAAWLAGTFLTVQFVAISPYQGETAPVFSLPSAVSEIQVQSAKTKVIGQPRKVIDLLPLAGAQTTEWINGNVSLPFPGEETDERGFARLLESVELEDGRVYERALETHPEWRNEHGLIVGIFRIAKLPARALFEAEVGFLKGAAQTDGVKFRVYEKTNPSYSATAWCYCDGKLDPIAISLDEHAGKDIELVLEAHVFHTSAQDWAVWVAPRIVWE
jgi:hypothetical protein